MKVLATFIALTLALLLGVLVLIVGGSYFTLGWNAKPASVTQGPQGPKGEKGEKGDKGDRGPRGARKQVASKPVPTTPKPTMKETCQPCSSTTQPTPTPTPAPTPDRPRKVTTTSSRPTMEPAEEAVYDEDCEDVEEEQPPVQRKRSKKGRIADTIIERGAVNRLGRRYYKDGHQLIPELRRNLDLVANIDQLGKQVEWQRRP